MTTRNAQKGIRVLGTMPVPNNLYARFSDDKGEHFLDKVIALFVRAEADSNGEEIITLDGFVQTEPLSVCSVSHSGNYFHGFEFYPGVTTIEVPNPGVDND